MWQRDRMVTPKSAVQHTRQPVKECERERGGDDTRDKLDTDHAASVLVSLRKSIPIRPVIAKSTKAPRLRNIDQCVHNTRLMNCKWGCECGGSNLCSHNRQKSRCKECSGVAYSKCEHGKRFDLCCKCSPDHQCTHHGFQKHVCTMCRCRAHNRARVPENKKSKAWKRYNFNLVTCNDCDRADNSLWY